MVRKYNDIEILESAAMGHSMATRRLRKAALDVARQVESCTVPRVIEDNWEGYCVAIRRFSSRQDSEDFLVFESGSAGYSGDDCEVIVLTNLSGYLHGDFNAAELTPIDRNGCLTFARWAVGGGILRFAQRLDVEKVETNKAADALDSVRMAAGTACAAETPST